ncbi:MAG: 2Fe-2S iron-sulfur cluster-binding protein [Paracoccaceae bacterium]
MSGYRLATGGVIDRERPLEFTWDGRRRRGYRGDTLASALLASGERIVARGFKYHRPRGIMSAGPEEGGALVTVGEGAWREPNAKATEAELFHGLVARGQNAWPSVRFDLGQVNDLFGRFFAAGFYYKTFFGATGRGTWEWMQFEKVIRRAAGMGTASRVPDPAAYDIVHDHCDLLIVGAGPAGLAAAEHAVAEGLDVILVERDFALGGALIGGDETIEGAAAADWIAAHAKGLGRARVYTRTTAFGLYDHGVAGLYERVTDHLRRPDPDMPRGRVRVVRAGAILLATGAIERPFLFGDNDRPGVMLSGAVGTYLNRYGVAPAESVAIATNNDLAYRAATAAAKAGLQTTVLDARAVPSEAAVEGARAAGADVRTGRVPVEAIGARSLRALTVGARNQAGEVEALGPIYRGCLGVSGGWNPAVHLLSHRGVKPVWSDAMACFLPGEPPEGIAIAGAAAGRFATEDAIEQARAAAAETVARLKGRPTPRRRVPAPGGLGRIEPLWEIRAKGRKLKGFVDPQHDVTADDIRLAAQEGYRSVEHMKRYTTLGMATDQGKTGGVVGLALLAEATERTIPETGITTFRPPYTPVPIGAFAGRSRGRDWKPTRRTPMQAAQEAEGAVFTDAGLWRRAWWFPDGPADTLDAAYVREATAVRTGVGMVDVSTLGKIAVQGPDAAEFLNRIYVNGFAKLPVMKCRYGVMLRDDGFVFDDGVTWRLGETEFMMTTTTAAAPAVMGWLELLLATRWPELRVHVASVTDQWAGVAVAGPRSREALGRALAAGDVSDGALPFMGIVRAEIATSGGAIPVLVARISFSGERAFEVYAPADLGPALWQALGAGVRAEGGMAYGMEALGALRIEKGHLTHAELDGRVTLADAGLGRMASSKKAFIGQALAGRPDLVRDDRPRLAHFRPVIEGERFSIGAVVCAPEAVEGHGVGWITGVTVSPLLDGGWLGIGFVAGGPAAWAEREVVIADPVRGQMCRARVSDPHALDPKGDRMHG